MVDRSYYSPFADHIAAWQPAYTPGPLTEKEFEQFFHDGFVIKHQLIEQEQLQSVIEGVERVVDQLAEELFQGVRMSLSRLIKGFIRVFLG